MIARKDFLRRLLGGLLVAAGSFLGTSSVRAAPRRKRKEEPTASPDSSPEPSPSVPPSAEEPKDAARLRLWKTSDTADVPVKLRFLPHKKPDAPAITPLEILALSYQFGNYTEVPTGPMVAEVSAPERATVRLPLHLAADSQSTLLIRLKGPALSAEWIDDTPDAGDAGCEFDVYNFLFAGGDVQVDFGTLLTAHLAPGRSSARLVGIKRGPYSTTIAGVDGAGRGFHWTTEVDFRQYRKAALLIYPDSYGRIRPRITSA